MKKVLISGITGQDGSYLAELLLDKGYDVYGFVRRVAFEDPEHRMVRILYIKDKLNLVNASLDNFPSIYKIIKEINPDEVYHLAAQSYVSYSFEDEFSTLQTNINGTHFMLSSCKELIPSIKFYFAGSSEMFGEVSEVPQNENTPFHPRSPYGISKVTGFELTRNYREAYGLFACNGILFNHESPRRGFEFVTRKIVFTITKIINGLADCLYLGNLDAKRDWGYAKDYVNAMWLMLQKDVPDDYVIASGETHSVREFVELAFKCVDIDLIWEGKGLDEKGIDKKSGKILVKIQKDFFRPAEVNLLKGDASKAKKVLNWTPTINFTDLISMMIKNDLDLIKKNK
jgi:GDPmannose 4,6-dehydratase